MMTPSPWSRRTGAAALAVLVLLWFGACGTGPGASSTEPDASAESTPAPDDAGPPARGSDALASFAAEQVYLDSDGRVQQIQKVYAMPDRFRMEMSDGGADEMIMIYRRDRNLQWIIVPEARKYIEKTLDPAEWQQLMQQDVSSEEEDLGTETINGYPCRKKRITTTVQVGRMSRTSAAVVWTSNRIPMPLRIEMEDGSVTELRNIRPGRQRDDLFEPPQGYQKAAGMGEMMGMMPDMR